MKNARSFAKLCMTIIVLNNIKSRTNSTINGNLCFLLNNFCKDLQGKFEFKLCQEFLITNQQWNIVGLEKLRNI
jgi:hypothetical protein